MTDLIPWWVFFAIIVAVEARERTEKDSLPFLLKPAAVTLLIGIGVLMNGIGVMINVGPFWNSHVKIDEYPERLWDWQHPPFLHWIRQ